MRHRDESILVNRDLVGERSWHASPDIRPRPVTTADGAPRGRCAVDLRRPATAGEVLRQFQAALPFAVRRPPLPRQRAVGHLLRPVPARPRRPGGGRRGHRGRGVLRHRDGRAARHRRALAGRQRPPRPTCTTSCRRSRGRPIGAASHDRRALRRTGSTWWCTGAASLRSPATPSGSRCCGGRDPDFMALVQRWLRARPNDPRPGSPEHVPWAAAVNEVLDGSAGDADARRSATAGRSSAPTPPPGAAHPRRTLDNLSSGVVTFDLDLTGVPRQHGLPPGGRRSAPTARATWRRSRCVTSPSATRTSPSAPCGSSSSSSLGGGDHGRQEAQDLHGPAGGRKPRRHAAPLRRDEVATGERVDNIRLRSRLPRSARARQARRWSGMKLWENGRTIRVLFLDGDTVGARRRWRRSPRSGSRWRT